MDDHQEEEMKSVGELSKVCSPNCSEMLVLGTKWKTGNSVVSEQTCTTDHKMDERLKQTISRLISSFHHTCEYKQCCYGRKHCEQMQIGTVMADFGQTDFGKFLKPQPQDPKTYIQS